MKGDKYILKDDIKERLLSSEIFMAQIAEIDGKQVQTVRRQLQSESPSLTRLNIMEKIREILNIPAGVAIHQIVKVGDKELHHE